MTREEAIKWFEWNVTSITVPEAQEAFRLAISALREQESLAKKISDKRVDQRGGETAARDG